ncbi:MAG: IS1634 family transposase [Synergistaceae bacterium]|nr:IS1634 family transposase [Synergistaceae bacterium]
MNIRETKTKNKYGSTYTYLQLVHNHRDKVTGKTVTKVFLNLGRKDKLSTEFIRSIVENLSSLLDVPSCTLGPSVPFAFHKSKQLGGSFLLDALWKKLGMGLAVSKLVSDRSFRSPVERMCFALVAGRILDHGSKLSLEHWVENLAYIRGLAFVDVHSLYRVMDFMFESGDRIQQSVFTSVAKNAKLDIDVIFLDTTNTYFECKPDTGVVSLKKLGYSKDKHPELPLVSIAFAVTRDGIPVRHWVFPGNTSDQSIVEKVKDDLSDWNLGNVVMVEDAGFNSDDNRRVLRRECGDYIIGEKLRTGSRGAAVEALHRHGRYKEIRDGLFIKDVVMDEGSATQRRYVIVKNSEAEKHDRLVREDIVKEVQFRLDSLAQIEGEAHTKAICALRSHGTFGRYVRQSKSGVLSLNQEKIAEDSLLDGKFLVSASNMKMKAEDIVMGYKQLWVIERLFRDMKNILNIRPVYHRLEERIKCHVLICWMAMILIRVAENETGMTWHRIEKAMSCITAGAIESGGYTSWIASDITAEAVEIFEKLKITPPQNVLSVEKNS